MVGADLLSRTAADRETIAQAVWTALRREFPVLSGLPQATKDHARQAVAHAVDRYLHLGASRTGFDEHDLEVFARSAELAVHEGIDLHTVLAAGQTVAAAAVAEVWRRGRPGELVDLLDFSSRALRNQNRALDACTRAYVSRVRELSGDEAAEHALAHTVLSGKIPSGCAARFGYGPGAAGYLMAVVPWSGEEPDLAPLRQGGVWTVRRVETTCVVTPLACHGPAGRAAARRLLELAVARSASRHPGPGVVAHARTTADLEHGERLARDRLGTAAVWAPLARLVEAGHLLAASGPARSPVVGPVARGLLRSLETGTGLVDTLRAFYATDRDHARTAELLGIHRRTLNWRLNRVHELTGYGPSTIRGIRMLSAALASCAPDDPPGGAGT